LNKGKEEIKSSDRVARRSWFVDRLRLLFGQWGIVFHEVVVSTIFISGARTVEKRVDDFDWLHGFFGFVTSWLLYLDLSNPANCEEFSFL
jgi:hypothetical protein